MITRCPHCECPLPPSLQACPDCGKSLAATAVQVPAVPAARNPVRILADEEPHQSSAISDAESRARLWSWFALVCLVAAVVIASPVNGPRPVPRMTPRGPVFAPRAQWTRTTVEYGSPPSYRARGKVVQSRAAESPLALTSPAIDVPAEPPKDINLVEYVRRTRQQLIEAKSFRQAIAYCRRVVGFERRVDQPGSLSLGFDLIQLGIALEGSGNYEDSASAFEAARDLFFRREGHKTNLCWCLGSLVRVHRTMNDPKRALGYLDQLISEHRVQSLPLPPLMTERALLVEQLKARQGK